MRVSQKYNCTVVMVIHNISAETEFADVTFKMESVVLMMLFQGIIIREVIQKETGKAAQQKSQTSRVKKRFTEREWSAGVENRNE